MGLKYQVLYSEIRSMISDKALAERVISAVEQKRIEWAKVRRIKQKAGIERAKQSGVHCGRKPKEKPDGYTDVIKAYINDEISMTEAAERLGVSRSMFYRWLQAELREESAS